MTLKTDPEESYYGQVVPVCEAMGVPVMAFIRYLEWGPLQALGNNVLDLLSDDQCAELVDAYQEISSRQMHPPEWRVLCVADMVTHKITADLERTATRLDEIFDHACEEGMRTGAAHPLIRQRLASSTTALLCVFDRYAQLPPRARRGSRCFAT